MIIKQNEKVDQSFWWLPWTRGVNGSPHCGVDIFGKEGTEVRPSVGGVVLYSGWFNDVAGNMIVVLGPRWKLHEYMHLKECFVKWGADSGPSYGNRPARKNRKRRQDSSTPALHDTDSRAAFPVIRQGLWERPAA